MEKIKGCISQNPQKIKGCITSLTQSLCANVSPGGSSDYYYTKVEIDAFRVQDREYVDSQDLILQSNIDASGHKIVLSLNNNILTSNLLDVNDNIISTSSVELEDQDKYIDRAEYDSQTQSIVFYYNDGTSFSVSISSVITSLETLISAEEDRAERAEEALSDRITTLEDAGYITQDINTNSISIQYTKSTSKDILISTSSWQSVENITQNLQISSAYGNDYFVSVGVNGSIIYSQDGINWTVFNQIFTNENLDKIVYGNGYFLAFSYSDKKIYKSYEPNVWTILTQITENITPTNLQYVNNMFIITTIEGKILTSTNGEKFKVIDTGIQERLNAVAYGNTVYVAVGFNGSLLYSKNLVNWYNRTNNNFTGNYKNLIYTNGKFIAVTDNLIRYSTNYYQFYNAIVSISPGYIIQDLVYGESRLYVLLNNGTNSMFLKSLDGITYSNDYTVSELSYTITYGKDNFISVGASNIYYLNLNIDWSYIKPTVNDNEYIWARNVNYLNNGDILYSQAYFLGFVDKTTDKLENYYTITTANDLLDTKQDDMANITSDEINTLFE